MIEAIVDRWLATSLDASGRPHTSAIIMKSRFSWSAGHPLIGDIHDSHLQSSDRKLRTMYNRVHVLIASPSTANGKKMQLTTRNGVLLCGGSTKLDVRPAGGGMAGVMEEAMTLGTMIHSVPRIPQWTRRIYKKVDSEEKGSGQPRDVKSNQKLRACQGLWANISTSQE